MCLTYHVVQAKISQCVLITTENKLQFLLLWLNFCLQPCYRLLCNFCNPNAFCKYIMGLVSIRQRNMSHNLIFQHSFDRSSSFAGSDELPICNVIALLAVSRGLYNYHHSVINGLSHPVGNRETVYLLNHRQTLLC